MSTTNDKEYAAIDGDSIVMKADRREELIADMTLKGLDPTEYEIVALPKPHYSMLI